MQRAIGSLDSPIRLPTSFRDIVFRVNRAVEKLSKELNRRPTAKELAEELGVSAEILDLANQRSQGVLSLDVQVECDTSRVSIIDNIEDAVNLNTLESLEDNLMLEELFFALENFLDDTTRLILSERSRPTPTPWRELEVLTGLNRPKLKQIERNAINKCKVMIETHRAMGLGFC